MVAATAPVVSELRAYVQEQSANVDETGWWQKEQRGWLWSVVTRSVTVFVLALSRSAQVAQELIDPSAGQVITTDRYKGYDWLPLYRRQICWAHLRRDFQAMVDRHNAGSALGDELLLFAEDVFTQWYRVRDGTIRRATLRTYVDSQRPWFRAADGGSGLRLRQDGGGVPRPVAPGAGVVDVHAHRRRGTDQ